MKDNLIKKYSNERVVTKNKMGSMVTNISDISKQFIDDASRLPQDHVVVDVGCCYGVATLPILKNGACRIVGIDLSSEHLDVLQEKIMPTARDRFTAITGMFPGAYDFPENQISMVHASHMLQFLTGEQMVLGLKKCYRSLKFGGKVYFTTTSIYLSWTQEFLKDYARRVEQNMSWPGEINNFLDYVPGFAKARHSNFIHLLTKNKLIEMLEKENFIVEQAFYYDLEQPENKSNDNKELIGVIARK